MKQHIAPQIFQFVLSTKESKAKENILTALSERYSLFTNNGKEEAASQHRLEATKGFSLTEGAVDVYSTLAVLTEALETAPSGTLRLEMLVQVGEK